MDQTTESLLLIPTDDTVVFPGSTVTIAADVGDAERVFLVPRHENDFASVGTVAEVIETTRLPGGQIAATVEGLHRARPERRATPTTAPCASTRPRTPTSRPPTSAPTS